MPRNTGLVDDLILLSHELESWEFVKLEIPGGTLYYTNRDGGYTGNIDGTVRTWTEYDFSHGPLKQGLGQVLNVNWAKFENLNNNFTTLAFTPGLRGIPITFYTAWWRTSVTPSVFVDAYVEYEGLTDNVEIRRDYVNISIKPFHTPWTQRIPFAEVGRCTNDYRNPLDCQYAGAEPAGQTTCNKTRQHCRDRSNEINANIYDDAPKAGSNIYWGGRMHGLELNPQQEAK